MFTARLVNHSRIGILVAGFLVCSAISQGSARAGPEPNNEQGDWRVELCASGGFAGIRRCIRVSSGGELTVIDRKSGKTVTRTACAKTLDKITGLLQQAGRNDQRSDPVQPQRCNDCIQYKLIVRQNGMSRTINVNTLSLGASPFGDLIGYLSPILNEAQRNQERQN